MPDSWVRGFLQVSSAMTMPAVTFNLHPMDVHNMCFILRRYKEKMGPRSMKYILNPGEPIRIVFEPWNYEVKCSRSIYKGAKKQEIRVWGRRRLLILERLIPVTKQFTVHLLGSGLPSFYLADLGDMNFTLGLSGWTANDWSRAGNFDLMAPRANVDSITKQTIFNGLKENWVEDTDALANRLGYSRDTILGALGAYTQAGRAIYDLNTKQYRIRELSREPLPMDKLRFANPREEGATKLIDAKAVKVNAKTRDNNLVLSGSVKDRRTYYPQVVIDGDQRIIQATCSCNFYNTNKLRQGPCEHILALRMQHGQQQMA